MSTVPILTFKAGKCDFDADSNPPKIKPLPTPGYVYLYNSDELTHFCWRPRSAPLGDPDLDLIMIPCDGNFIPYTGKEASASTDDVRSPTDGRVFVLKFSSSSQRYLFWLQSKSKHPQGDKNWFSPLDLKLGQIVDMILTGEEVDVQAEIQEARNQGPGGGDDDETMEDVEGTDHASTRDRHGSTGGAGAGATGGDIREEGEESREGGADGGRAASASTNDASALVQNFLRSLQGGNVSAGGSRQQVEKPFTTLPDLLPSSVTISIIESASPEFVDTLIFHLPPTLLLLAQEADDEDDDTDPDLETVQAIIEALSQEQKKDIIKRVLRSPQLHQSLGSLTVALRDGGLPMVSEALKIKVENGGFMRRGGMPLGGGDAVEAFLKGIKNTVEEKQKEDRMETD